jgi:biotin carboxyl carrier protein
MTRKVSIKVGGKERLVEIDESEGALRVTVDGVVRTLDVWAAEPGVWVLHDGGGAGQTVAWVDGDGARRTVEVRRPGADPALVAVEIVDARAARVAALARRTEVAAAGPITVRSTIPGRVVKLLVRPGDRVAAGQAAVVLEAMKMENELRVPRAGTVRDVRCAEGAAVEAGQDLVVIN